jgi:hypothetical protein
VSPLFESTPLRVKTSVPIGAFSSSVVESFQRVGTTLILIGSVRYPV